MKTTIRFILVSFLFCMYAKNSLAQMDTLFTDTVLIEIPFQHMVDSCFEHVDLDLVPTGLLLEHGYPTIDVKAFDGTINDSNYAHTYSFRKAYGTLLRSFIDSTAAFDTLGTLVAAMQVYVDSGLVPISILNYQYNSIKPSALDDSLFYLTGLQLHDVPGRTQSPYESNTCFMAAPALSATDENTISFVFNEDFYISNDARTVDHLEVDFGNGTDHILAWGDTITIVFDSTYTEGITLDLFFTDETSLSGHFTMEVNKTPPELGPYNNLPDITNWAVAHEEISDQLVVSVRFGCGNSSGAILKPFIILNGYGDPLYGVLSAIRNSYPNGSAFVLELRTQNRSTYDNLFKQGYDLVFVSYIDGSAAIQTNAAAVEEMIQLINEEKWAHGSTHKNVLLGVSMGGIVGRYALAHMYQQHIANSANPNHDTKLFFSFDSPHWGANAPLGLQAMVVDLYRHWKSLSPFNRFSFFEYEDVYWDYRSITSPAAKQMLINHVYWNNRSLHTDFYDELRDVSYNNGQEGNIGCRTIAISNGSGKGVDNGWFGQYDYFQTNAMYPSANMLNLGATKNSGYHVWAVPANAVGNRLVYKGYHEKGGITFDGVNVWFSNNFSCYYAAANQCNALDCAPGGNGNVGTGVISYTLAPYTTYGSHFLTRPFQKYCFVPTISALHVPDADRTNYFAWIDGGAGANVTATVFSDYITNDKPGVTNPSTINNYHPMQTRDNTKVFDEITTEAEAESTLTSTQTFNYGNATSDRIGNVEINSGCRLAVNKNMYTALSSTSPVVNGDNAPADNTHFVVFTYADGCNGSGHEITAKSGSEIVIGDDASNRSGDLVVTNGSTLILEGGSDLKIYGNSKLIIEEGAELKIVGTPTILLNDANSIIEIHGKLTLDANAQLNIANSSSGHIVFKCPTGSYCTTDIGSNCEINVTGANREDKVIKITGKGLHLQDLENFSVTTGTIELGNNTELVIDKSLHLDLVKITRPAGTSHIHKGITINSQQGSDEVTITGCLFEYAETGLTKSSTCNLSLLTLETTAFANCSTGLYTNGNACNLNEVRFDDCVTNGWLAEDMTATSNVKTYAEGNTTAINYTGNSSANLYVYESTFANNTLAVSATGAHVLAAQCNHFVSNTNDVYKSSGSLYLDGSHGFTPAGGGSTVYGGNNTFDNTATYSINMSSVSNLYVQGQNLFTYSVTPTKIFTGTLSGSTLALDNNQWSIYDGSTTQNSMYAGMWGVSGVSWSDTYDWTGSACSSYWNGYIAIPAIFSTPETEQKSSATKNIFVIYPNPTDKLLHVKYNAQNTNYTIKAVDMTGRIIYLHPTTSNSQTQSFDVSNLAAGLYQVIIEQNGVILAKEKIVVRR